MMNPKRVLLLVPLSLGAALWGVNWKLDHPPQTTADKEFQFQMRSVDTIEVVDFSDASSVKFQNAEVGTFTNLIQLARREPTSFTTFNPRWKINCFAKGKYVDGFLLLAGGTILVAYGTRRQNSQPWAGRLNARAARRLRIHLLDAFKGAASSP